MQIQKVVAKNFYSFKRLELDLQDYKGAVRINGENQDCGGSNGSGKSSIFESIVWGLFGKTLRKSTEESLVNSQEGRDCSVSITLNKSEIGNCVIYRSKRPTSLDFKVNGVSQAKESAVETQKHIEALLETDYRSFLASVVFGGHSDYNFLDSTSEEKRGIIRNCFNLDDIFSKRTAVKELKSKYTGELKTWNTLLESLLRSKKELEKNIPAKKYKYIELPSLEQILKAEKDVVELESQIKSIHQESLKQKKDQLKKVYASLSLGVYEDTKECPVCKSPYVKSQSKNDMDILEANREELLTDIEGLQEEVRIRFDKVKDLTPKFSSSEWARYNEKNKLVQEAQIHIDNLDKVLLQISTHESKIKELSQLIEVMKFWELAFSEKGVIKYVIRNILEYFNLRANEYISILTNNQFSITFNDELVELIKNNGIEVKFISLSSGERRKINLGIMLSLQDLSAKISKTNCNLIFFDEVCDNIDDKGIESIFNLLNTLKEQYPEKVLMLITHSNLLSNLLSESQEIKVVKNKGISEIV